MLPEDAGGKPDSRNTGRLPPDSELNTHLQAVLKRLEEREGERRK